MLAIRSDFYLFFIYFSFCIINLSLITSIQKIKFYLYYFLSFGQKNKSKKNSKLEQKISETKSKNGKRKVHIVNIITRPFSKKASLTRPQRGVKPNRLYYI